MKVAGDTDSVTFPISASHICDLLRIVKGVERKRGPRHTMYKENRFNRARQRESQQAGVKYQIVRYTEVPREKAEE